MVKIGTIIGDRYEILEKIGTGGMSDVYKARDKKLNRFVAVKVLKQEFSENANFVSKFKVEAQAAAGLMHSNIVNVYDVGEEDGVHFIVMELVEGITLKKYIEKKARLSYKEAVSIAIQVSMGIDAAHNHHIIHRDIKPQNIIISKDGKVKVTDFGIAKAATSNTITSNVMGSVHYTSPEQARGGYSDEKSDIYSLGITMFEMLTGRVPFNGETTVAIAIKHIQEEMPSPKEFVPEIPTSVENIVLKCCQKSPDRRYQNMQELITDLKQSLINPEDDFVVMDDVDQIAGTRTITDSEMNQIKRGTTAPMPSMDEYHEDTMRLRTDVLPEYDEDMEMEDYDEDKPTGLDRLTVIMAVVLGILVCIGIGILAVKFLGDNGDKKTPSTQTQETAPSSVAESSSASIETTQEKQKVKVRNVKGMMVGDAKEVLQNQNLVVILDYQESSTIDEDVVISTSIAAETEVEEGTEIHVVVSSGVSGVAVPDVEGLTYEQAESEMKRNGFKVIRYEAYSDTVGEGYVISQNPVRDDKIPEGSNVTLTVSRGPENVAISVPKLIGITEKEGIVQITNAGLKVGTVVKEYSNDVPEGAICYQSYPEGTQVDRGTSVDIKISLGPEQYTYKCNISVDAPTLEEAPGYIVGTDVKIKLVADSGQVLLETKTNTFPQAVNSYGINCSGGTLTLTYQEISVGTVEYDADGNEITTPGSIEEKTITRRVEFVKE